MVPIQESFNIVVTGAWNPSIFSAEWILNNLAQNNGEEGEVQIAYDANDPSAPRKITFEGLNLYPGRKRIYIHPTVACKEDLIRCANVVRKILTLLEHTPIGSLGINIGYAEREDLTDASDTIFQANDYISILGDYSVDESSLTRRLSKIGSDYVLAYSFTQKTEEQKIAFNFHFERPSIERMKEVLEPASITAHFDESIIFANIHYNLTLEDPETED